MEVKRYEPCGRDMAAIDDGRWVSYSDYSALRAEVGRLEKALRKLQDASAWRLRLRDGVRDDNRTYLTLSEEEKQLWRNRIDLEVEELIRNGAIPAAQPEKKPAVYPECPECGGTSWELDASASVTRHCADCGAEIQPFSADELARSEKVVKRVMLTITPCGYGCKDGKDGGEIWINGACPTHSRAVGFNDSIGGESICKPASPAGGGK